MGGRMLKYRYRVASARRRHGVGPSGKEVIDSEGSGDDEGATANEYVATAATLRPSTPGGRPAPTCKTSLSDGGITPPRGDPLYMAPWCQPNRGGGGRPSASGLPAEVEHGSGQTTRHSNCATAENKRLACKLSLAELDGDERGAMHKRMEKVPSLNTLAPQQPSMLRRAVSSGALARLPSSHCGALALPSFALEGRTTAGDRDVRVYCEKTVGIYSEKGGRYSVPADRGGLQQVVARDIGSSAAKFEKEGQGKVDGQLAELWSSLPQDIQTKIVTEMLPSRDMQAWRQANKHWASTVSSSVTALRPSPRAGLPLSGGQLATIFPRLKTLDLFHVAIDISCRAPLQLHISQRPNEGRRLACRRFARNVDQPASEAVAAECVTELLDGLPQLKQLTAIKLDGASALQDAALHRLAPLTGLTQLSLSGASNLNGEGLSALAPLSRLAHLSLSGCRSLSSSSVQHLSSLVPSLTSLQLDRCQGLDDSVGAHLSVLTSLQSLSLRGCRLTEEVLPGLAPLTALRSLSLQGLQVAATRLHHIKTLTALEDLNLHGLNLGDHDRLTALAGLTRLTTLNLRWCEELSDANLRELAPLTQLKEMYIDRCRYLTSRGIGAFCAKLSCSLTHLCLSRCPAVDDALLTSLVQLKVLKMLDLEGCHSDGFEGRGLRAVAALPALSHLNLKGCKNIESRYVSHLRAATELTCLNLSWCPKLAGDALVPLGGLPYLETLNICFCRRLTQLPVPMPRLRDLNISGCIGLSFPWQLEHFTGLEELSVEEMETENIDEWARAAGMLPKLSVLSFYDCEKLTDVGVSHLSTLKTLTYLCLRSCYQVQDAGILALVGDGNLPVLSCLSLEGLDKLTDTSVDALSSLRSLRLLSLAECDSITASGLEAALPKLFPLCSLDVSGCAFLTQEPSIDDSLVRLQAAANPADHDLRVEQIAEEHPGGSDSEEEMVPLLGI